MEMMYHMVVLGQLYEWKRSHKLDVTLGQKRMAERVQI